MAVGPWASVFDEGSDANRAGQSGSYSVPEMAVRCLRMKRARLGDWSTSSATLGQRLLLRSASDRQRNPLRFATQRTLRSADSCSPAFSKRAGAILSPVVTRRRSAHPDDL